ncbi:phage major capsid protein, HK97 family [Aliiroseovarius sediminilitoris]|uniref:Phage major capsid protein, HK97 family n=1 Tax=Aliiroseovarius sediminilitoris TaxID=1173584 RepID=A0A1I0Q194_9RHOB|nr:phage major capsid protein [Aliiroseovarius sediminilitoris]SEW20718.1 phage major capsid protein, HK97 family [Aliiroseovarius sediminilitoris]
MSKNETKAQGQSAATGVTPAAEVKTALAGFMSDINAFHDDITTKLQQQEERLTMLDRKSNITAARPHLAAAADLEAPHQKAFEAYLRSGDDDGLRGLDLEGKAMSTAVAGDGGYLVDPQTAATIQSVLKSTASLRAVANVVNVEATSYDVLIDHSDVGSGWATETDASVETGTPSIERITIPLHELSALPKASQRLLDDSAFEIETWLAGRIADKFARAEAGAFISGDGIDKPKGILAHPSVDNDIWSWGNLGYVVTGTSGDFDASNPADAIIDLVYALDAEYRAGAKFVMNSKTAGAVRKMKDMDGRFLWSDGLAAGEPARLLGYPVLIAEDMPDIGTDATPIAFGDFGSGYTIAERPDTRILRDPFSAKPHVLFYATKRVGGDVSDFAAIKLLKFSVS